jgi:hypothetical protein
MCNGAQPACNLAWAVVFRDAAYLVLRLVLGVAERGCHDGSIWNDHVGVLRCCLAPAGHRCLHVVFNVS